MAGDSDWNLREITTKHTKHTKANRIPINRLRSPISLAQFFVCFECFVVENLRNASWKCRRDWNAESRKAGEEGCGGSWFPGFLIVRVMMVAESG
jgi:hypothetical protein